MSKFVIVADGSYVTGVNRDGFVTWGSRSDAKKFDPWVSSLIGELASPAKKSSGKSPDEPVVFQPVVLKTPDGQKDDARMNAACNAIWGQIQKNGKVYVSDPKVVPFLKILNDDELAWMFTLLRQNGIRYVMDGKYFH